MQRLVEQEEDRTEAIKQAVLGCVVHDHRGLWSVSELERTLQRHPRVGEEPTGHAVEDAIGQLYAVGLLHRIGRFVCATQAALAAAELDFG